jgi:N6-L-threonylcarbamoyladenine synthase
MQSPHILSIDTSCDETAVAVSRGRRILSNVIASQINIHKKWGGVVPHLAKRAHQQKINFVIKEALQRAKIAQTNGRTSRGRSERREGLSTSHATMAELSCIAVTIGPGLAPALEVGIATAKSLAKEHKKPLISLNHMQGHLLAPFALNSQGNGPLKTYSQASFPLLGLLVSGGHTQLVLVKNIGQYQLLGETLDDAAGEALDKLAKMLKLGYPGGPILEEMAKKGQPDKIPLPVPMQHSKDLNFSFSGLKTAALYTIQKQPKITKQFIYDMAASFQQAIATSLTTKLSRAIETHQPKAVLLGGGVISNLFITNKLRQTIKLYNIKTYLPYSKKLLTDNAAMMCLPAYFKFQNKDFVKNLDILDRQPSLNFSK